MYVTCLFKFLFVFFFRMDLYYWMKNLSKGTWHKVFCQIDILYFRANFRSSLHQYNLYLLLCAHIDKYEWILLSDSVTYATDLCTMSSLIFLRFLNINNFSVITFTVHQINKLSLNVPSSTSEEQWIDNKSGSTERTLFSGACLGRLASLGIALVMWD